MENVNVDIVGTIAATEKLTREAASSDLKDKIALSTRAIKEYETGGKKFADLNADGVFEEVPVLKPLLGTLNGGSLSAVADYIKANPDQLPLDKVFISVMSPTCVYVVVGADGAGRRNEVLKSVALDIAADRLNCWLGQEEAMIALMTRFRSSEDRVELSRQIGNLKAAAVQTSSDDGQTQLVSTEKGVKSSYEKVKPIVLLNPMRSFPEIDSGETPFLVRFRQTDNSMPIPQVNFIEGDGGAWQARAKTLISDFLRKALADVKIAGILA